MPEFWMFELQWRGEIRAECKFLLVCCLQKYTPSVHLCNSLLDSKTKESIPVIIFSWKKTAVFYCKIWLLFACVSLLMCAREELLPHRFSKRTPKEYENRPWRLAKMDFWYFIICLTQMNEESRFDFFSPLSPGKLYHVCPERTK
jgi:hypothetical protein